MESPEALVERLFGETRNLPPEERAAYLDRSCDGRPEVRRRIELLLEADDWHDGFPSGSATQQNSDSQQTMPPGGNSGSRSRLGRYAILEQLGAGGMGVVYRARDEKLQRSVAIKVLTSGLLTSTQARSHFRREALALARVNHSHIATVYDVGEQDGIDYIVMECVQGQSLKEKLSAGPLNTEEATRIVLQIAEALEEAHAQGVIHRDLKPANVMITPRGQVKVLDFGLAKLLAGTDSTQSHLEGDGPIGTPHYMSPEQALGKTLDARTDLWSLGALYYEALTGRPPFEADNVLAVLRAVIAGRFKSVRQVRQDVPVESEQILDKALERDGTRRYATAKEMAHDVAGLLQRMSSTGSVSEHSSVRVLRLILAALVVVLLVAAVGGWWLYRRAAERRWAREQAIPQIESFLEARRPLAAFQVLERAERALPSDPGLKRIGDDNSELVTITSDPPGAEVSIQDYLTPNGATLSLGATPLNKRGIPKGYFRWTVSKPGFGKIVEAPETQAAMNFSLSRAQSVPPGMVYGAGGAWSAYVSFLGWIGPYKIPPYYVDQFEVTNRDYQKFVDGGGYEKSQYWPGEFHQDGRTLTRTEAMQTFRDTTGRPGPSTWAAGHYPAGKADDPVTGVSWFEATAYAAFAGKALPVIGQWYQTADFDVAEYTVQLSNLTGNGISPAGKYQGLGPYGTYDMAGNVREWTANLVDGDLRFILGGSWKSPNYLYTSPEALSPFDRSDTNGFRCVRNLGDLPQAATQAVHRVIRDFAKYKPVSDDVFRAYTLLYAYPKTPLNARSEGVVKETEDWREEKVTFDAAYNGERMAAYLFLPKRVRPPYQTVLFFPSARVLFLPPNSSELGDVNYFDYIIQSGRAVIYPVYEDTYERRLRHALPSGDSGVELLSDWYKDASRSLDYLETRQDISKDKIGYLGVSMGSADGVIVATLLQDRLKTVVFLDGGYFLQQPSPGADQADFVPRLKKPVLMVNGRFDYTFPPETSQDPMFRMLGTPPNEKSHVVLDTPHDVTEQRPRLTREVLSWLDHYLGGVQNN
jgi:formylglycine-generating enzyme required for sulfatase activity/tRNA A-37 threonylcarbamoyl transferase component Bud32